MSRELFEYTADAAMDYREELNDRSVMPSSEKLHKLKAFDEALPESTTDPISTIKKLHSFGSPATVATTGRRFFGFVQGGALPVTIASSWLASTWDQNACLSVLSPIGAKLEEVVSGWVLELMNLPRDAGVGFVSGASMASISALAVARHALLKRQGYDLTENGSREAPRIRVVTSQEVHPSNIRALNSLGFGNREIEYVECDEQGRILVNLMPEIDALTIVILQAGSINSGSFDSFESICKLAAQSGAWVHVDGAFGAWARVSKQKYHLTKGMELADSHSFDFHKWLNVPQGSALYVCKDESAIRDVFSIEAPYLVPGVLRDPANYTPELSRRAYGVDVWAALRHLGRSGVENIINTCCAHAALFAKGLENIGFEILNEVCLNQVTAIYEDENKTIQIIKQIQHSGVLWLGPTKWKGRTALRISISSWATTEQDVQLSLKTIQHSLENIS